MSNARDKANIPSLNFSSTGIDDNATSTAITIDSSENVGIGTSSPDENLHIQTSTNTPGTIKLKRGTSNVGTGEAVGELKFATVDISYTGYTSTDEVAKISAVSPNSFGDRYDLAFYTGISSESTPGERLRITNNGKVGINISSPNQELSISNSGDTGLELISGTSSIGNLLFSDSGYGGIGNIQYSHSDNSMRFGINTSERMRIDSSGNVGIGTTSPSAKLDLTSGVTTVADNSIILGYGRTLYPTDAIHRFRVSSDNLYIDADINDTISSNIIFQNDGTERMRITSGSVLIGTTGNGTTGGLVALPNNNNSLLRIGHVAGTGNTAYYHQFFYNGSQIGSIWQNGTTGVSYNTSSDYRLKENIVPINSAIDRVKALNPVRFNFKSEPDRIVDGFLAHEAQSVVPEAVGGTKDETETKEKVVVHTNGNVIEENIEQADWETGKIADEDGNTKYPTDSTWEATKIVPVYQGIDQSKLVPVLTKALQEAVDKIEQLEARITTLENK